ncbi:alpha/beta hydrolase [Balneola sp. MJW-20]|uniref:alpha/beta hydrolase n=1 Tax=Gracilimonas aurantiaca TaxID=3234185 RepID=UPI00346651EE
MSNSDSYYSKDILGDEFQQKTLGLTDDYEGKVIATLIRRTAQPECSKAVLYIHGFNDYFFQAEMAKSFNEKGYNFYALDLRKYGRSLLGHQKVHNVRSLREYDEEIGLALKIIRSEGSSKTLLMGHSTGGLIVTNYAGSHRESDLFQAVICNSPFFEFNLGDLETKLAIPFLSFLGRLFPDIKIPSRFSRLYGYSIHKDHYGEWDYSLEWKPHGIPKISLGFIHAVHIAQKKIQNGLSLEVPVLILHSHASHRENEWTGILKTVDAVLNVDHIRKYAKKLAGEITMTEIENGMHDLMLSEKPVRDKVYAKIFQWAEQTLK